MLRYMKTCAPSSIKVIAVLVLAPLVSTFANLNRSELVQGVDVSADIVCYWEDEFNRLQERINPNKSHSKSGRQHAHMLSEHSLIGDSDKDALDVVLRRTRTLLSNMAQMPNAPDLSDVAQRIDKLDERAETEALAQTGKLNEAVRHQIYLDVCALRRQIALSNPLLDFEEMLFVSRENAHWGIIQGNSSYTPRAGGGLYIASNIKSSSPRFRNLLSKSKVENGPLKGQAIHDKKGRSFQGPELSYDGKTIVFAYTNVNKQVHLPYRYNGAHCAFHIFKVNIGSSELVQLTNGIWKDYSPCWLPNGRIVFISERRQLTNRCSTLKDYESAATLFSMEADGSDLFPISWHEVDELHPSVDENGMLVYTRWDYVDRDFNAAHHFWICCPDGRNPRAPHGNYPRPHHTFEGSWEDGRANRPWAEQYIRAVPGTKTKYVAVATGHHLPPHGPLILIDTAIPDDDEMSQIRVITGDGSMPMDDTFRGGPAYVSPWPLSVDYYIAAESKTKNVFLIDKFGNRELLFSAPVDLPVYDPVPLKPRPVPLVLSTGTFLGQRADLPEHKRSVISILSVYESDFDWPVNTKITALRIIEIFPRTWKYSDKNIPEIGYGHGSNARMVLGTVPVEDDGSAYFEAPVGKAIYFQALDEHGMAVQSMRSCTYVHPGEHLSCQGCHENKWRTPTQGSSYSPKAMQRPPSRITPEVEGSRPFSFWRLVVPVLIAKCMDCHKQKGQQPDFTISGDEMAGRSSKLYDQLEPYAFYFHGEGQSLGLSKIHGGYRTIAGRFGARQAPLLKYLSASHYDVNLTKEEFRRVTLWLDCNSNELGAYRDAEAQRRGEVVWPEGVDPGNPVGIEYDRPIP